MEFGKSLFKCVEFAVAVVVIIETAAAPFAASEDFEDGLFFAFVVNGPGLAKVMFYRFGAAVDCEFGHGLLLVGV